MRFDYDELKKIASDAKIELIRRGDLAPSRRRIRRKPRDPEKLNLLYRMAMDRTEQYPPYRDEKGRIVLPYFKS